MRRNAVTEPPCGMESRPKKAPAEQFAHRRDVIHGSALWQQPAQGQKCGENRP